MILNYSRAKTFNLCKRKAFNWHHRGVEAARSMNLVDGGAFHTGVAVGRATHDWQEAEKAALELFEEDVKKSSIPEEQMYLIEEHRELTKAMVKCFAEHYEHETYQIIQPECVFDVPLKGSEHNCIFMHWMDAFTYEHHWGSPPPEAILGHRVASPHTGEDEPIRQQCKCWQPHRIVGRTDAVVNWNGNIWLDEYKTTSIKGQQFWDQWQMDIQPAVYMWGIWRSIGLRPRGFLLNAIYKPSEAQVANWNSKRKYGAPKSPAEYLEFSREAFLRSEEDLLRVEQYMKQTAQEWEQEVVSCSPHMAGKVPFFYNPSNHTCMSYNRKCDYWSACMSHDAVAEFESMMMKLPDYVDGKLIQITEAK